MKPKNFALVVLVVAIVGIGLWWFTRSTAVAPEKTATALMPAKTDAPKQVAPMIITPPIASPAPIPDVVPVSARPIVVLPIAAAPPDPSADPQTDLKTAIPDVARLYRAGDQVKIYLTYTRPDQIDSQIMQQIQTQQAQTNNFQDQPWDEISEDEAASFDEIEDQTPILNAAGDEATYMLRRTDAAVPPGTRMPMTMIKINGKWYFNPKSLN
jgi:hypothetical protein